MTEATITKPAKKEKRAKVIVTQSRLRSPVAWTAVGALIFFVVKTWVGFEIPGWDQFIVLFIAVFSAFGIFNNPTSKKGF